jgi:hypothetical protein
MVIFIIEAELAKVRFRQVKTRVIPKKEGIILPSMGLV